MARPTFCYVILAHRFSGIVQLVRRVRELSPGARVMVRFEDPVEFDAAALRAAGATPLCSTIRARWGAWSLTEAMLEALANARAVTGADYLVLISGQDYPVRDLARWEQQVVDSGADALLDPLGDLAADWRFRWYMVPVPRPRHAGGYRAVRHLAWRLGRRTGRVLQVLPRFVEGDRRWLVGVPRLRPRPPGGLRVTKCSQWMTLSARAVDVALARDAREPALRAFFATVRISDESYLQSLLHDDTSLAVRYSATTGRIIDPGSASPHLLDAAAVRAVALASDAPFVRKLARDDDAARAAADALLADREEPGELAPPRLPQFARAAAHHRPTLRSRPCR